MRGRQGHRRWLGEWLTAYAWDIQLHSKATPFVTTTFRELGVQAEICDALDRAGIITPFAIQEMTLSVALLGTDLIGQARTGTGKTLAAEAVAGEVS